MDFLVSRHARVPVRRQIRARLTAEIRDGGLAPGTRLPTVRALAERLEVHRNTVWAAYRELERDRLVRSVRGGGVYVLDPTEASVVGKPATVGEGAAAARVVVVESAPGLRRLLARELGTMARGDVPAITPGELRRDPGRWSAHLVAARPRRLAALLRRVPDALAYPLPLAGGLDEWARARRLPGPGVVTVVTISASVRSRARTLLAPLRCRGIAVALPDPADAWALDRALRIAALVVADAVCVDEPAVRESALPGRRPLVRLRVLRREALAGLRARARGGSREAGR